MSIESIAHALRTADDWDRKGQPGWVSFCLSGAIMNYLRIAVAEHEPPTGIGWMREVGVAGVLRREFETLELLAGEVDAKRLPTSVIAGNYRYLVFAHAASCLSDFALGEAFVRFAGRADVLELSTPFWREYSRGMGSLVAGERYEVATLRLAGQERYWASHLKVVSAVCAGESIDGFRAELEDALARRNEDKRIKDDGYGIEGSGFRPVKWDFRAEGLFAHVGQKRR